MLNGKVIIVTGGGSGIGRATAELFAADGAKVVIADWHADQGAEAAAQIEAKGGAVGFVKTDVSDEAEVAAMVQYAVARYGKLDGAFNNAGVEFVGKAIPDMSSGEWRRVIDINLNGVFLCMKYEMAAMRKTGGGAIVNTSSGAAVAAPPFAAEYTTSKAGVAGLTRAASAEFSETKVRVNAILPGVILTPMTEQRLFNDPATADIMASLLGRHSVGRWGKPEDVARAARWLLSDECPFVNGACLAVDGGYTAR